MSIELLKTPFDIISRIEILSGTERDKLYNIYNHPNFIFRNLFWGRLRALLRLTPVSGDAKVLDYGTGFGVLLPSLSRYFRDVYAIDILTEAVEYFVRVMDLSNVHLYGADGTIMPFEDETFDLIIAADVLEHFPHPEPGLDEIHRTLKTGGHFLFSGPVEDWTYEMGRVIFRKEKPQDHYHTAGELKKMISERLYIEKSVGWPVPVLPTFLLIRATKTIR